MKRIGVLILSLALTIVTIGCASEKSRAVEGAVIGGLLGGAAGGIIGHQSGHGGEGAGIGVAAGALTGALVGSQIEKKQPATTQAVNPNQLSMQQIVDMSKQGVNEAVIIDKIKLSNTKLALSAQDIESLKSQGVSNNVINAMQGL